MLHEEHSGPTVASTVEPSVNGFGEEQAVRYQVEAVWPSPSEAVRQEVVDFWVAEGALPDRGAASERSHQLLVVARESSGRVAGVSTALPVHVKRLGFKCFFYRTFVGHAHRSVGLRSTGLWRQILLESHRLLNDRFQVGYDQDVLGIYMEIENHNVMRTLNEAVWQSGGMNVVYVGRTATGRHTRVWYFDGARVP